MASSTAAAARSGSPPTTSTSARRSASIARIIKSVVEPAEPNKLGGDLTDDVGAPVSGAERSHQCGAVEAELDRLLEATVVLERLAEVRVGPPKIRLRALL